jgi:hypothetical protein
MAIKGKVNENLNYNYSQNICFYNDMRERI